jgi:predicted nucleic acid-binding protein
MNGNKIAILDSNILIYLSKGKLDFASIASNYSKIYLSVVTYIEVLGFNFNNPGEEALIKNFIRQFEIVQTDMDIADKVVAYRKIRKIKTPDAIILATARKLEAELISVNVSDFKSIDNAVSVLKLELNK